MNSIHPVSEDDCMFGFTRCFPGGGGGALACAVPPGRLARRARWASSSGHDAIAAGIGLFLWVHLLFYLR